MYLPQESTGTRVVMILVVRAEISLPTKEEVVEVIIVLTVGKIQRQVEADQLTTSIVKVVHNRPSVKVRMIQEQHF